MSEVMIVILLQTSKNPSVEDRGQTDRVTMPTRIGRRGCLHHHIARLAALSAS